VCRPGRLREPGRDNARIRIAQQHRLQVFDADQANAASPRQLQQHLGLRGIERLALDQRRLALSIPIAPG
jgi:hypothetical protein